MVAEHHDFVVEDQGAVLAALEQPGAYAALGEGAAGTVRRIDTQSAVVFLVGDRAVKLKRAVRFPFLDFGTLARRRAMCAAEIEVNRRSAPTLYLGIAPVLTSNDGTLRLGSVREPDVTVGDEAQAREWAVVMQRFDEASLFVRLAERQALTPELLVALAAALARFHDSAPVSHAHAGAQDYERSVAADLVELRARDAVLDAAATGTIAERLPAVLKPLLPLVQRRQQAGAVRRVHGDLHLRNICLVDGAPTLFDAIEFNDRICTIDVLYDLAFLLMDLDRRDMAAQANFVLNHYLWRSDGPVDAPHLEALALMPSWLARRACIRAFVEGAAAEIADDAAARERRVGEARAYQQAALRFVQPPPPALIAIGGLSGSGKTTLAVALAPGLGAAPGAVIVRSDIERKRLAGLPWDARLPPEGYTQAASARTYAELLRRARIVLAAGHAVIVDAVSSRPDERAAIEALARDAGVPFLGIWLDTPLDVARQRVDRRTGDASDAGAAVVERQRGYDLGDITWPRIDAGHGVERVVAQARALLSAAGARG
ncbi:adenylyl-sulfate kinase [Vineibacter terrae]|uniref:Adenylyl-sulfate kinase n=1 Tax=Vineibacter terrae TaxID=2586908 RepID=A0A5C8PBH4_9HYPH|nr:bifunctional aminoglycoside phosphotransferase/ATP-binding protein [Vineibacter terrae]TXL71149.1 adenylyl-sulfate kinase [Vineibacter terrae]